MLKSFRERYGEQVRQILEGTEIVQGTDFYEGDRASLDLGGRQLEFQAIGTAHSPGDPTIFLPKERILFVGDLIEERMFPIVPFCPPAITKSDIDVTRWVSSALVSAKPRSRDRYENTLLMSKHASGQ